MKRRRFLAVAALGALTGAGGCSTARDGPSVPDGMTVETRHWVADVLEEGLWYHRRDGEASANRYHELVADETAARDRIDGDEDVDEFVRETDFERSSLLIVQTMMQSARWLELARIERRDDGLDVAVVSRSPDEPYGDDAAVHSLAIRVTDERAGIPDDLRVTVDGEPTGT